VVEASTAVICASHYHFFLVMYKAYAKYFFRDICHHWQHQTCVAWCCGIAEVLAGTCRVRRRVRSYLVWSKSQPVNYPCWLQCRKNRVFTYICLYVCFPHDISKTDAARITILDTGMFQDESWKPIYFGVKSQGHKSHKKLLAWVFGFLWLLADFSLQVAVAA